jgi:2'-5' RNA ligase
MRFFIGIKASRTLQKSVCSWRKANKRLPVRFIKGKNLHITIVPPWYEKSVMRAKAKFEKITSKPFEIIFDYIKINAKKRVVWIEAANIPDKYTELCDKSLKIFSKDVYKRKRVLHVTLARYKRKIKLDIPKVTRIYWKEQANNITLFRSKLLPDGSDYIVLKQKTLH